MKLLDIIKEENNLNDAQLKKIRSIHRVLKSGTVKMHFKSLSGDKVYHLRYELSDEYEPCLSKKTGYLEIRYGVNMNKPNLPCKIWLMDPEQGEILLNDKLTTYDKDCILFGSGDSGWKTTKELNLGRLYRQALVKIYTKFLMFNISVNMFPKEDK